MEVAGNEGHKQAGKADLAVVTLRQNPLAIGSVPEMHHLSRKSSIPVSDHSYTCTMINVISKARIGPQIVRSDGINLIRLH